MNFKNLISLIIILISFNKTYGQHCEMKKQLSPDEKKELLNISKKIFNSPGGIKYSISTEYTESSFSKINNGTNKNSSLEELENGLSKDSLNPAILFRLGLHYSEEDSLFLANRYFEKAYNNINHPGYHGKDSSAFYAMKGFLEYRLKYKNAFIDFEKALSINPNTPLALPMYSGFLMSSGRFSELKKMSMNALDQKCIDPVLPYICLIWSAIFETGFSIQKEIQEKDLNRVDYRKKDFNQLFDFSLIEKYGKSSKRKNEMKNARCMADILALEAKIFVFEKRDNDEPIMEYTQNDLKRLEELKKWLIESSKKNKMNEYSVNFNLGHVYYMLNKQEDAIASFNKAIEIFPLPKRSNLFDPNASFEGLLTIFYCKNDTTNFRLTIQKKIAAEVADIDLAEDYRNMAFNYFLSGQLEKAKEWGKKAKAINPRDIDNLRLLAHLYFLEGMSFMTEFYINDLAKLINDPYDGYLFSLQIAIYQIYNGEAEPAFKNISIARKAIIENHLENNKCEVCDKLVADYIKTTD